MLISEARNPGGKIGLGDYVEKKILGFSKQRSPAECWNCGLAA